MRVSPKTFESYQSKSRLFAQWLEKEGLGDNDVTSITGENITQFFDYLIHDRQLQGRTIEKYEQIVKRIFEALVIKRPLFENPMPVIQKVANRVDYSAKPIRKDDIDSFKEVIKQHDPQLWLAIQFQFYCFIRPGTELRLMRLQWIDFYSGTITIPSDFAKNGKQQTIAIPRQFLDVIINEFRLNSWSKNLYVFGHNGIPGDVALGKNTLRNRFNKYRDALKFSKDYKFYSWKHTGGISASNAGVPVKDIQMQMRHHSLDVTDKYLSKMRGPDSDYLKNRFPTI